MGEWIMNFEETFEMALAEEKKRAFLVALQKKADGENQLWWPDRKETSVKVYAAENGVVIEFSDWENNIHSSMMFSFPNSRKIGQVKVKTMLSSVSRKAGCDIEVLKELLLLRKFLREVVEVNFEFDTSKVNTEVNFEFDASKDTYDLDNSKIKIYETKVIGEMKGMYRIKVE